MRLLAPVFFAVAISAMAAEKLPKPDRIPTPATLAQAALVRDGTTLHDQKDYDGAIAKYRQVIAENPWEVMALYELSYSYFESGKYEDALATARTAAQCKSPLLPRLYLMMGNALDELGRGKESIDIYQSAIKQEPQFGPLHYNLGVSLNHAGKKQEAKAESEKAVQYEPAHSSNHALLAALYRDLGYRVPSIFAYSQFLLLEPDSPRAKQALPMLQNLITGGVSQGKDPTQITIMLSDKSPKDEGDFLPTEMMMSVLVAGDAMVGKTPGAKPQTSFDRLVSIYSSIGESLSNSKPKGGFAAKYYAPYFAALAKAGHTEAFVAAAWTGGNVDGAAAWIDANRPKLEAFQNWLKSYQWPTP